MLCSRTQSRLEVEPEPDPSSRDRSLIISSSFQNIVTVFVLFPWASLAPAWQRKANRKYLLS